MTVGMRRTFSRKTHDDSVSGSFSVFRNKNRQVRLNNFQKLSYSFYDVKKNFINRGFYWKFSQSRNTSLNRSVRPLIRNTGRVDNNIQLQVIYPTVGDIQVQRQEQIPQVNGTVWVNFNNVNAMMMIKLDLNLA